MQEIIYHFGTREPHAFSDHLPFLVGRFFFFPPCLVGALSDLDMYQYHVYAKSMHNLDTCTRWFAPNIDIDL